MFAIMLSGTFCTLAFAHYGWVVAAPALSVFREPRLACAETQFDCGEVPLDRKLVEHDFVIRNTGWQPLHLTAKPACGSCSTVKLSKDDIAPGDTSVLTVTLHLRQMKKGKFNKHVLLNTDAPRSPQVVFAIRGTAI